MAKRALMLKSGELVSTTSMCLLCGGISKTQITRLAKDGVISQAGRGRFAVDEAVRYWKWKLSGATAPAVSGDLDRRFREARAEVHEIEARKAKGELLPRGAVAESNMAAIAILASRLDGMAPRVSALVPPAVRSVVYEAVANETADVRRGMAGDLARYCDDLEDSGESTDAAAAEDAGPVGGRGESAAAGERGAGAVSQ